MRAGALVLLAMLFLPPCGVTMPAVAQPQALDIPFTVTKPAGNGPFPAVVIMHDCSGLGPRSSGAPWRWSADLTRWGYVTIWPDSFSTRGHPDGVCREAARADVRPRRRVADAQAALAHLKSLPFVDPRRIAIMGGSHGGSSTLATVDARRDEPVEAPFAAAIALYPSCKLFSSEPGKPGVPHTYRPRAPVLILVGELDDWTPAADCERLVAASKAAGEPIEIEVYKDAHHSFDSTAPIRFDASRINSSAAGGRGATVGGNPAAWERARAAVRAFLAQRLAGPETLPQ